MLKLHDAAEALFASPVQPSTCPTADEVTTAVQATIRRLTVEGCAGVVAKEYGDHPGEACLRMSWALATVRQVYRNPFRNY